MPNIADKSEESSPTLQREREFSERQRLILEAAAELFAEKGFHRATTREIAEASQVSEGTLYNYFENKDDFLLSILALITESQEQTGWSDDALATHPQIFFTRYLEEQKTFWDERQAMMQAIMSEILSNAELRHRYYQTMISPALKEFEKQLQFRKEKGQIREVDISLTARLISGILMGLYILQAIGDPLIDKKWDSMAELTSEILYNGIAQQPNDIAFSSD